MSKNRGALSKDLQTGRGFGKKPTDGQKRFISNTVEDYYKLLEASKRSCQHYVNANVANVNVNVANVKIAIVNFTIVDVANVANVDVANVNVGSETVYVVGLKCSRIGDSTDAGALTSGSETVFAGG